jgi:hypothetical protein
MTTTITTTGSAQPGAGIEAEKGTASISTSNAITTRLSMRFHRASSFYLQETLPSPATSQDVAMTDAKPEEEEGDVPPKTEE